MQNFTRIIPFFLLLLCTSAIAQISGTKTIGGASPDYATLTAAVTALQTSGINGDVTFNIRDGVYNESFSITGIAGSENYNIVFQSQSLDSTKVRITFTTSSSNVNLINISNVKNITFKYLSLAFSGNYSCSMVKMSNGATNIKFQHVHFNCLNTSAYIVKIDQPTSGQTACQSLEFSNSTFDRSYTAITISGGYYGIVKNLNISSNKFNNQKGSAISLSSCENLLIKANSVNAITTNNFNPGEFAFGLEYCKDFEILNNKIFSSFIDGVKISYCSNTSSLKHLVSNNFITTKIDPDGMTGRALKIENSDYLDAVYNSLRIIGGNTGYSSFGLSVSSSTNLKVVNNIIYNNEYGAVNLDSNTGILQWDYNYLLGTTVFGKYNTTEHTNFADWKTASALDANSVTGSIAFTSQSDLHIVNGSAISNKGTQWAAITKDIDDETRSTSTPDIGADEFAVLNQAPVINNQTFSINENKAAGSAVGNVVASDPDLNQLTYSITAGNASNFFAINSSTGAITVNTGATLDYESTSSYVLTVKVEDNGTAPMSSSASITININNVNEAPVINNQTFSINENAAVGSAIGTVAANDPDAAQTLAYSITAGNTNNTFAINRTTGAITVNTGATLNFESKSTYTLTVKAEDNGTTPMSSSATVTINLNDVNEAPSISNQTFSISENAAAASNVGTVAASDPDAAQTLTYSITAGNTSNAFAINSTTGAITVNNGITFNYDNTPSYSLTVKVDDNGSTPLSSSATITINITDVNEAPVIANQTFSINENSAAGTAVGSVIASDPNTGQALTYSITEGNTANAFAINGATGAVTVNTGANLNYDVKPVYSLTIKVTDNGTPSMSSTAVVTINIKDVQTGLDNIMPNNKGIVYPNPSNGIIRINECLFINGAIEVEVYNTSGQLILKDQQFTEEKEINLTGNDGLYSIRLKANGKTYIEKIIVRN